MAGCAYAQALHAYNTRNDPRSPYYQSYDPPKIQNELYYNFSKELRMRRFKNLTRSFGRFALSTVPLVVAAASLIENSFGNSVGNSVDVKRIRAMNRLRKIQRWWKAKFKLRVPVLTPQEQVYFNRDLWSLILSYTKCPRCNGYRKNLSPCLVWRIEEETEDHKISQRDRALTWAIKTHTRRLLAQYYCNGRGRNWMFEGETHKDGMIRLLEDLCCRSCDPMRLIREGQRILDDEAFQKVSDRKRANNLKTRKYNCNRKRRAPRSRRSYNCRGFFSDDE